MLAHKTKPPQGAGVVVMLNLDFIALHRGSAAYYVPVYTQAPVL